MIPTTVETKFLIGRALVKIGAVKDDPLRPPLYSAGFIMKQLSFHASIVTGTILGALWPTWRSFLGDRGKLSMESPWTFMGEQPWYVFPTHLGGAWLSDVSIIGMRIYTSI
jgi:hypothetical protein